MKKIISMVMVCAMILSFSLSASELDEKRDELSQTQQAIEDKENAIEAKEFEIDDVQGEIDRLEAEIAEAEEEFRQIDVAYKAKQEEVNEAEIQLEEATLRKDIQYEATKDRMAQMYKNSKTGFMKLFFSASSISELLSRAQYVRVISEYDNEVLDDYKEQERIILELRDKLEEERVVLQDLRNKQVLIRQTLEEKKGEQDTYIAILNNQVDEMQEELEAIKEEYEKIEDEIADILAKSTLTYGGGEFLWPVPGYYRVSSGYYDRINPVTFLPEFHKGIDIPAPHGVPVVAAAPGKVIASGPRGTFGNTVIVDHGSGLTTLYAHNSSVSVSVGQYVAAGDEVAKIGTTGRSTGNHLHFEVGIHGQHTSPWNYLSN